MIRPVLTQIAFLLEEGPNRQNLAALAKFLLFLVGIITLYTVIFQVVMVRVEGQEHSWLAAVYWTLTTMSTLGYGDIVFVSDIGRTFSLIVLLSGILLLLVVLPFIFIRFVYAPWIEARLRLRLPKELPRETRDHVILCDLDPVAESVIEQLRLHRIPYVIVDPDPERAGRLHRDGFEIVHGELDNVQTWRSLRAGRAKVVVANLDDTTNTNVILTVRDVSPEVPVVGFASSEDAVDLMELAGATHVLPLRRQLGEQLSNRINAGHAQTHIIGRFRGLVIAEFPVLNTPLVGKTIRQTQLGEQFGINVVAVWEAGELQSVGPDFVLGEYCLPIVIGTEEQMRELDELLYIYDTNWNPVIVIGGGKVGRSATRSLKAKGVPVHIVERKADLAELWDHVPDRMFVGDAANRELLEEAGIHEAPAVLLTTNDDAMNVFLAVYCRRLNPSLRIVSRVTHERNIPSIQRAGADLVLSYAGLGMETIVSLARGRTMVLLGEGVELFEEDLPRRLEGKTLADSEIRAKTGMNVVAVERNGELKPAPPASEVLRGGSRLYMIGTVEQLQRFTREYGPIGH